MKSYIYMALALIAALLPAGCTTDEVQDITSPRIISTSPANGEVNVKTDTSIRFSFDENMDTLTLNAAHIFVRSARGGSMLGAISTIDDVPGTMVSFKPDVKLMSMTTYIVTVAGDVADLAGNTMAVSYSWSFTTGAAPRLFGNAEPADAVTGQSLMNTSAADMAGAVSAMGLNSPAGNPAFHNGALYLSDTLNNRVLGFINAAAMANAPSADFVLGQADFLTNAPAAGAAGMNHPRGLSTYDGMLFVADTANNRVLIYNSAPIANSVSADLVIGQADFAGSASGCSQSSLNAPASVRAANGQLMVADTGNNRVLVWLTLPAASGAPADVVAGQPDFTTCAAPASATPYNLAQPSDVISDGLRMAVADTGHNRVLIYNSIPRTNMPQADVVIGQPEMYSAYPWVSALDLNGPTCLGSDGANLYIADTGNSRVLLFDSWPLANYEAADVVIGQGAFALGAANDADADGVPDASPSAITLSAPAGLLAFDSSLAAQDTANNRTLIYNSSE